MKGALQRCIDGCRDELFALSRDIWSRPEVAGAEAHAHDTLVGYFSRQRAWTVERQYKLPTAFRATWGPRGAPGDVEGGATLNVGFLCEYDALPGIGHACGHNLIAEVGVAAAVGFKCAVEKQTDLPFQVKVTFGRNKRTGILFCKEYISLLSLSCSWKCKHLIAETRASQS